MLISVVTAGSWVSTHWAPYWWTCDVCSPGSQPDFVLKTETLDWDLSVVLGALGLDTKVSLVHSHWSRIIETFLSLVETFIMMKYFQCVTTPALLCHKEPARSKKDPTGHLFLAPRWFFMA